LRGWSRYNGPYSYRRHDGDGAVAGTVYERMPGIVGPILERYGVGRTDLLIIVSKASPQDQVAPFFNARMEGTTDSQSSDMTFGRIQPVLGAN
jgi:hypothetical protein